MYLSLSFVSECYQKTKKKTEKRVSCFTGMCYKIVDHSLFFSSSVSKEILIHAKQIDNVFMFDEHESIDSSPHIPDFCNQMAGQKPVHFEVLRN